MKFLLITISFFFCTVSYAQKTTIYYDNNWMTTAPEKATYYADFIRTGNMYQCNSYWVAGNVIHGKSTYPDTVMLHPSGLQVLYFKNGHVEDSVFYEGDKRLYVYHYYRNGTLAAHYYIPPNKEEGVAEGFDEDGKKIKSYVFEKEAEFKGGSKAWQQYIVKNVTNDFKIKDKGDVTAKVDIKFIVNKEGEISAAAISKSSGYPQVDKDALRVIKESPAWNSAIQFNEPVNAFRIQPFVYKLNEDKK